MPALLKIETMAARGLTHLTVSSHLLHPDANGQRQESPGHRPKLWVMAQTQAGWSPKVPLGL